MPCATLTLKHRNLCVKEFMSKIECFNYSNEMTEVEKENRPLQ